MYNIFNAYRFTFTGERGTQYENAIIDTVRMLGFMSLKNGEHAGSGANVAATKRIVKEAIATRKAADALLARGVIVLNGTWSNGIEVGPGPAFVPVAAQPVAEEPKPATTKQPRRYADGLSAEWHQMARRFPNLVKIGACYDMRYADGATCPISIRKAAAMVIGDAALLDAVARPQSGIDKPRVRVTLAQMRAATVDNAEADALADAAVEAITGEQYAPAPIAQPAPIVRPAVVQAPTTLPAPMYAPQVGDTVFVVLRHENGTTTDRVIDVTRVGKDVFRGHDRRYGRTRNFYAAQIAICRKWDGQALYDHNGEEVVRAA